jgi:hypothetical protein
VADALRGRPDVDGPTKLVVALLVLALAGFFAAAVLAVYGYATPGAEWPVILTSLALAVTAGVVKVASAAWRHFMRH